MHSSRNSAWISWSAIGVLAVLCGTVAFLQYRWIGEISEGEKLRMREDLHERLREVQRHVDEEISSAVLSLHPNFEQMERLGVRAAYEAKYQTWRAANGAMFSRIGMEERRGDTLDFYFLNREQGTFFPASIPGNWGGLRDRWVPWRERPRLVPNEQNDMLLEVPVTGFDDRPSGNNWLFLELNLDYVRSKLLPEALRRYLATGGKLEYQAEVVGADPSHVIYRLGGTVAREDADGEVPLLYGVVVWMGRPPRQGPGEGRGGKKGPPEDRGKKGFFGGPPPPGGPPPEVDQPAPGPWTLRVQHQAGSLEALVAQTQRRNLGVSASLLVLILATSVVLVRYTRKTRELAELQMNFVAGVSHELRTPLTVIRTAAFNLRRGPLPSGERVERYGGLIEQESEKLTALVDQVLQFGSASNGQTSRQSAAVSVEAVIDEALEASQPGARAPGMVMEKHIAPDLPPLLADRVALRRALQNLIDNAVKYGSTGEKWLGISASSATGKDGRWIEIRVADHGPGIPRGEQSRIFEPFFRGQRAIDDQIHGTGLGLNLVQKIVTAHGGSIRLESEPGAGATFVIQIPAAPESTANELTNSVG